MLLDSFKEDINQLNFISYLSVHEFEGLLFSDPHRFEEWTTSDVVDKLKQVRDRFDSPEYINNSADTAPSKRISKIWCGYKKVIHGPSIASSIGLDMPRKECYFFNRWIEGLERDLAA